MSDINGLSNAEIAQVTKELETDWLYRLQCRVQRLFARFF